MQISKVDVMLSFDTLNSFEDRLKNRYEVAFFNAKKGKYFNMNMYCVC